MVPARSLSRPAPASSALLRPGTVRPWQEAVARASVVTVAVVAFGALAQWPLAGRQGWLFAGNLTVSAGFAAGSVLLSDELKHTPARRALLVASLLWSIAWVQVWDAGPLPFIASLTGPAPALVAIWGLLRFPQPWRSRRASRAVLAVMIALQAEGAAITLTEDHPAGPWWPRISAPGLHAVLLAVYNAGGIAATALFAGLFIARTRRLRGHELRITLPIAAAVGLGALATAVSTAADALGAAGTFLDGCYAAEDVLLSSVPLSFALSYVLRRLSIEELSGRVGPYDTLPEARDKLRRALRDPTLQILLPVTARQSAPPISMTAVSADGPARWVDASGQEHPAPLFPAGIPAAGSTLAAGRLLLPVYDTNGRPVAVISAHPSLARFGDLLTATVQSLALVLDNARMLAQLRDEVTLARQSRARVEAAVTAERRQIRHRAGTGPLIRAEAARVHLETAVNALTAAGQPVPEALAAASAAITRAAKDIRRLSGGAEPLGLANGLTEAIPLILADHPTVSADLDVLDGHRPDPAVELVAYFVVTAAVGNALKHAGPDAAVTVAISHVPEATALTGTENAVATHRHRRCTLVVDVRDDGPGGARATGHGLALLASRVASVSGTMELTSPAGQGTTIRVAIPCASPIPPASTMAARLSRPDG